MTNPTVVLNVVGLDRSTLKHMPNLASVGAVTDLLPVLPAVTCSAQATMLTGMSPAEHGVVGNGWYERDQAEVRFWKQSNHLVQGEKVWETARRRDPSVTTAKLFWWFNMHASVEFAATPRPQYRADGRKLPDIHTKPMALRDALQRELGVFPLFNFWGPTANLKSTEWIAQATRYMVEQHDPTLTLSYVPHLDYDFQRFGPEDPRSVQSARDLDQVLGRLITDLRRMGRRILVVSEYGIEPVQRPIRINQVLRELGQVAFRLEEGREYLDPGESKAFAVADHQVAQVYCPGGGDLDALARQLAEVDGVAEVLCGEARGDLDHPRAGDLVLVAEPGAWFTYDWWVQDERAPDYARTVDIHRKPGYDPCELLMKPGLMTKAKVVRKLIAKKFGFRTLFDVIPLRPEWVGGSHGRIDVEPMRRPVLLGCKVAGSEQPMAFVRDAILQSLFDAD